MESLEFLRAVWALQGEGTGFICRRRDNTHWFEYHVKFPRRMDQFDLRDPEGDDVYFTPNLFSGDQRRREQMRPSRWLYADLDTVDPRELGGDKRLRPTVAWSTSRDRFQALWLVQALGLESHERLNKQLSYLVGADHSGWDATQVLRLPGTRNHKYADAPLVELLWWDDHTPRRVRGSGMSAGVATGELLHVVELDKRAPSWIRAKLKTRAPAGDRSKVLFRMEADLLGKGWSKDEVFTLLRESVWNKFDDKRLSDDIHRVAERLR
jgi:hypothetical protein